MASQDRVEKSSATDRETLINRIKALRAKASDGAATEAEAFQAADFAARLMMRHEITAQDLVDVKEEGAVQDGFAARGKSLHPVLSTCWVGIQKFCEVKAYASGPRLCFIGTREDVMLAGYYAELFVGASLRVWNDHFDTLPPKTPYKDLIVQRESLYKGFGSRLADRLEELAEERKNSYSVGSGTALVILKKELIKEKMAEMGLTLTKSRAKTTRLDDKAYRAGSNAANRVNLNSPIEGNANVRVVK